MKFRKKPVTIEAVQYDGTEKSVEGFLNQWFTSPFHNPDVIFKSGGNECLISTLEGVMQAHPGDWIIRGVKGELYPCKDDIFRATYQPVDETGNALEWGPVFDRCPKCGTDMAEFPEMKHTPEDCPGPECTCYEIIGGHQPGCPYGASLRKE